MKQELHNHYHQWHPPVIFPRVWYHHRAWSQVWLHFYATKSSSHWCWNLPLNAVGTQGSTHFPSDGQKGGHGTWQARD